MFYIIFSNFSNFSLYTYFQALDLIPQSFH